ncbi:MAG: SpaA isopeptide-forming pilin-related protein [Eubacteriales bacterium]|jgi:hypothetical protein
MRDRIRKFKTKLNKLLHKKKAYKLMVSCMAVLVAVFVVSEMTLPAITLTETTADNMNGVDISETDASATEGTNAGDVSDAEQTAAEQTDETSMSENASTEENTAADETTGRDTTASDSSSDSSAAQETAADTSADSSAAQESATDTSADSSATQETETDTSSEKVLEGGTDTVQVSVTYDESAGIPDGAVLYVKEIKDTDPEYDQYADKTQNKLDGVLDQLTLYDIKIMKDGASIEPASDVDVTIAQKQDNQVEIPSNEELNLIHIDGDGDAEALDLETDSPDVKVKNVDDSTAATSEDTASESTTSDADIEKTVTEQDKTVSYSTVSFSTDGFSVFAVAGSLQTVVKQVTGTDYTLSVAFEKGTALPADTELSVEEITADSDLYNSYYERSQETLQSSMSEDTASSGESDESYDSMDLAITSARFFSITLKDAEGNEIEPEASVQVKIDYTEPADFSDSESVHAIHFKNEDGKETPEILNDLSVNSDDSGMNGVSFHQDSFSVTGVIVDNSDTSTSASKLGGNWPEDGTYCMIVRDSDGTYAVKGDGTLTEVTCDDSGNVTFPEETFENKSELNDYTWSICPTFNTQQHFDNGAYGRLLRGNFDGEEKYISLGYDEIILGSAEMTKYYLDPSHLNYGSQNSSSSLLNYRTTDDKLFSSNSYYLTVVTDTEDNTKKLARTTDSSGAASVYFSNQYSVDELAPSVPKETSSDTLGAPETQKTIVDNGDGTYTLSLSIKGNQKQAVESEKADVVVIFDTSSSMMDNNVYDSTGVHTRLDVAKSALINLGDSLLKNNTEGNEDRIKLSLITFNNTAKIALDGTYSETVFDDAASNIKSYSGYDPRANGGLATNWEDAFAKAQTIETREGVNKYLIFISDGNPTVRDTEGSYSNPDAETESSYMRTVCHAKGIYGDGRDYVRYSVARNYEQAKDNAKALVRNEDNSRNFEMYSIGAFGNISRMTNILSYAYYDTDVGTYPEGHYYAANDTEELETAFTNIVNDITENIYYQNVDIEDGLTSLTSSKLDTYGVDAFEYSVTDPDGNEVYSQYKDELPEAKYNNKQVSWNFGHYKLLKDYTYTVSFRVWPSQTAYDTLADLNNGVLTLEEANSKYNFVDTSGNTVGMFSQDSSTGKYYLRTNTNASVTYQEETTAIQGGESTSTISDEVTSQIDNPGGMLLTGYKITVTKKWEGDQTDRSGRPDSIKLGLYRDDETEPVKTITLNNDGTDAWTGEVYIAPGLYHNGEELEKGHNYYLKEISGSPDYSFSSDIVHPYLINSSSEITMFRVDDEGHLVEDSDGNKEEVATLECDNILRSQIRILKVSSGENTPLEGAEFKIYTDSACTEAAKNTDGNEIGNLVTDGSGYADIGFLDDGTYYLKETNAPDGYILEGDPIVVTVDNGKVRYTQTGNNHASGENLEAEKIDGTWYITLEITNSSGKSLPNAGAQELSSFL